MPSGKPELKVLPKSDGADKEKSKVRLQVRLPQSEIDRHRLHTLTIYVEILVGLAILLWVAPRFEGNLALFLVLAALNLAAERMPISIYGDSYITVGYVFTLPLIAFFGAPGAVLIAPLETTVRRIGRRPLGLPWAGNMAVGVIAYSTSAAAFSLLAPTGSDRFQLSMIPAAILATFVTFSLLAASISWNRALVSGQSLSDIWANHRWVAVHYAAFGAVGLSFIASYLVAGYWGILAYVIPALMLRLTMKQYVDKTAENVERLKEQNRALQIANVEISRMSNELRLTYGATLEALVSALEARDQETKGHSVRVARYMLNIAEALGVRPATQEYLDMQHGALLHDVGKIGVRDAILLKPASLTPDEWALMRKHPEIGYNILREVKFLSGAADIVLAHHERWDGAGYPYGLKGEDIPLGSRIFAVVDTFDTMTSDRVYRKALTPEDALQEILRCSGSQFDPFVVEAFLDIYEAWVLERERLHSEAALFKQVA
jgi:putative nucleotidyltransferase with HDIG domain